jgi:Flp pilus assembly CpaE family ATPase
MEQIKVLIIDADETSRKFLGQMLQKRNYLALQASNGTEGLETARKAQPELIVVETNLPDYSPIEFMKQMELNPVLARIPCIVLSGHSDPDEMQACLEVGYAEYFVKSGMVMMTMVESIPKILVSSGKKKTESQDGLLFVFLSAKGGTGTSSLCANIGMNIAQHIAQSSVAIADLVLPIGSIANIVGLEGGLNIASVTDRPVENITPDYVKDNLVSPPHWLFHLLPGCTNPREANQFHIERIPKVLDSLIKTHSYVLVDLGRALSKISIPIIKEADVIVLVLSTDMSTVTLTKTVWEFLKEEGIETSRIFPILNRAVGTEGLTKTEAEKALGLEIRLTMPYMMGNFTLANNQHSPISLKFPADTASMVLKEAAIEMSRQAIRTSTK